MRRVPSVVDLTSSRIAALARYWEGKRGSRPMPVWRDIDPADIKPLLPYLVVTRYQRDPFRVRYVLVGTMVAQYAGGDFTGRYLDELDFASEIDTDWPAEHRRFVAEARPAFGICQFRTESGLERDYELGMFPIAAEDGTWIERALCMEDFPAGCPFAPDASSIAPRPLLVKNAAPLSAAAAEHAAAPDLEPVGAGDLGLRSSLVDAGLPIDDLAGSGKHYFRLILSGQCIGYGGIEVVGPHALLRSVVIEGPLRGRGFGRTLVTGLLAEARRLGCDDAYLLTETAVPFFAELGFILCDRATAPPEVAATEQFAAICPASAKLMGRDPI